MPHDNRANDVPATPNPTSATEGLIKAVETFTMERGFQDVAVLVRGVAKLESDLERKTQELQALSTRIVDKEREFAESTSSCLKTFRKDAEQQDRVIAERDGRIKALEGEVKNFQEQVRRHNEAEGKLRKQEAESRKLLEAEKAGHEKTKELMSKLAKEVSAKNGQMAELKKSLDKAKDDTQKAKAALAGCEQKNEKLQKDLDEAYEELEELRGFAVELNPEELDTTISRLKDLWDPAIQLVQHYFYQDVSQDVIERPYAWSPIKPLGNRVPILRSNTRVAKLMRVSAILAILANLIDQCIFQPTYLIEKATELKQLLLDEAVTDRRKEAFMRAMLLASREDEQASISSMRVQYVIKEVTSCVQELLPIERQARFASELQKVVSNIRDAWTHTSHLERKVQPTFNHGIRELGWKPISLEAPPEKCESAQNGNTASERQDHVYAALCPGMYTVNEEQIQRILPGVVLMASQVDGALRELQNTPPGPVQKRTLPGRVNQSRSRRHSSTQEVPYNQSTNQGVHPFLS